MNQIEKVLHLRTELESAKDNKARAEGRLEAAMTALKSEYHCKNTKEAEALLERLKSEQNKSRQQLQKALEGFEKKWGEKLEL